MSARLQNIMTSAGFHGDVEGFLNLPVSQMLSLSGFGEKCLTEVYTLHRKLENKTPSDKKAEPKAQTILSENSTNIGDFQEYLKSITTLPPAKFKKSIIDSLFSQEKLIIPEDIRDLELAKALCFTRNIEASLGTGFDRVINRYPLFKDLNNLSIVEFFETEGVGVKAGKAFLVWYSTIHLGTYEELSTRLCGNNLGQLVVSGYSKSWFAQRGILSVADLKNFDPSPDDEFPALASLEARTLHYVEAENRITSSANLLMDEDLLSCIQSFRENELDSRTCEIVDLRYSDSGSDKGSLQSIGIKFGLTRERARQIIANLHKAFKSKYLISESYFQQQMVSVIKHNLRTIQLGDFTLGSVITESVNPDFCINFLADLFSEIPLEGHLQSSDSKMLASDTNDLKAIMLEKDETVALQEYLDETRETPLQTLLKLYAVLASGKYALAEENQELMIIKAELSLQEAVLVCVTSFDRPATIDEIVSALDKLKTYTRQSNILYHTQKKERGIGATSIFNVLQSHEKLVRIERYQWGLAQHVAYQDNWDEIGAAAAGFIGNTDKQYSAAYLMGKLINAYPLIRSRYELDFILKRSNKLNYLGYQTYTSLSASNAVRITIRTLINDILSRQERPILIQDLLEQIGAVRTMDYRGIFTALSQYPEITNYFNQFVTNKKSLESDLEYILRHPVFISWQLNQIYPYTEWMHFAQSIEDLNGSIEDYLKHAVSLENVQTHKTENSLWLVQKDAYLLRKAVVIVCAHQRAISLDEIITSLAVSFDEKDIHVGSLKARLEENIYIKKRADGLYSFLDPGLLRIEYATLLDQLEEILSTENGALDLETVTQKLSDSSLSEGRIENYMGIIKSDDRFTILTDNLICLS